MQYFTIKPQFFPSKLRDFPPKLKDFLPKLKIFFPKLKNPANPFVGVAEKSVKKSLRNLDWVSLVVPDRLELS